MKEERYFDPAIWVKATEARLVPTAGWQARTGEAELMHAAGSFKGHRAELHVQTYGGSGISYARFITLTAGDELRIGNVLCVGAPEFGVPIFGADLVKIGTARPPLLVADVYPTTPQADQSATISPATTSEAMLMPAWWREFSSPRAILMRPAPADLPEAEARYDRLLQSFVETLAAAEPKPATEADKAHARTNAYLRAHQEDDQGLNLLAKIFGSQFARRFIAKVMFPLLECP